MTARVVSVFFFFSSRRRHTRCSRDWSSDVCSSDLATKLGRDGPLAANLSRTLVASIGPVCSAALREHGVKIALEAKPPKLGPLVTDRKSTRLNSSHGYISYAVFCLKKNT